MIRPIAKRLCLIFKKEKSKDNGNDNTFMALKRLKNYIEPFSDSSLVRWKRYSISALKKNQSTEAWIYLSFYIHQTIAFQLSSVIEKIRLSLG
jgi:hypothetical protein